LSVEDVNKLKIRSGEHIGTILTTAFLGCAPIDTDTGPTGSGLRSNALDKDPHTVTGTGN
jgi:hypothetical protein